MRTASGNHVVAILAVVLLLCLLVMAGTAFSGHDSAVPGVPRNGTGFVVDDKGRVVTGYHVVAGCRRLAVRRADARVGASLLAADRGADLALLVPRGRVPAVPVSFRSQPDTRAGERVVVAGFPREVSATGWLRVGAAEVVAEADPSGRFRINVPVGPGNSGGPVFDRSGRVIGVAAGTLHDRSSGAPARNPGVVIGGDALQGFLRRAGVAYRLGGATVLGIRAIAERARDSTVLVECF